MDPNETLAMIREAMHNAIGDPTLPEYVNDAFDAMGALDEWLTRGGFLPIDWETGR